MSANKVGVGGDGAATFSDGDVHELLARTVTDFSAGIFTARITVRRVSDGAAKSFLVSFGYKKEASGTDAAVYGFAIADVKGIAGDLTALAAVTASVIASGVRYEYPIHPIAWFPAALGVRARRTWLTLDAMSLR